MAEENIFKKTENPKAVLVSVLLKGDDEAENEASLCELETSLSCCKASDSPCIEEVCNSSYDTKRNPAVKAL